tara:strand:+ start:110 stop:487 length:378 start_codon:yes stop_codon:yes gene_type:complete
MAKSIQVLGSTGTQFNVTSDKVRGDSFYGFTDGLHTIAFYLSGFIGKIYVEGTLASDPTATDWFIINLDGATAELTSSSATTATIARTFEGNFVYLRVRIDRDHISPANNDSMQNGQLTQVFLNH